MDREIMISLLSLLGTLGGSLGGILVSSKLTSFRLEQLEKKVDKHNRFAERMPVLEEQLRSAGRRIEELERDKK